MLFVIASAGVVNSQSNFNCSMFPNASVPGDFVRLLSVNGNDSHAEPGSYMSGDYSIACKSNITTIGGSCAGNYVDVVQLAKLTDAHVSVDDTYTNLQCFNASAAYVWFYDVSASTPADYECVFAVSQMDDAHVYECDSPDADYNVNLKVNMSILPNCPVISSPGTYVMTEDFEGAPNAVPELGGGYTACVRIVSSDVVFECNGFGMVHNSSSANRLGMFISSSGSNVTVRNCGKISGYSVGVEILDATSVRLKSMTVYNNSVGIYFDRSRDSQVNDSTAYNNTFGFYLAGTNRTLLKGNTAYNASGSLSEGFKLIGGSNNNTLIGNKAYNISGSCFDTQLATANRVSRGNQFINNTAYECGNLFYAGDCAECSFINNTAYDGSDGFDIRKSDLVNVTANNVHNCSSYGIRLFDCGNGTVSANRVYLSNIGIQLYCSISECAWLNRTNNTFIDNLVYDNSGAGFSMYGYRNNFTNNTAYNNSYGFQLISPSGSNFFMNNSVYNNTVWAFYLTNSANNTITGNTLANNSNAGIYASTGSNYTNITYNSVFRNGAGGIAIISNSFYSNITGNRVYENGGPGISIQTSANSIIDANWLSKNYYGVYVSGQFFSTANNTRLYSNTFQENAYDLYFKNTDVNSMFVNMSYSVFRDATGTARTNLSMDDAVGVSEEYTINYSVPSVALPVGRGQFNNMFVNISPISSGVMIDRLVWGWDESQVGASKEGNLELWKYNTSVGWTKLNNSPDTAANTLTITGTNPASDYGILERAVNCPNITAPGTYYQPMDYTGAPNDASEVGISLDACVKIGSSDVIYDCNGFHINQSVPWDSAGIVINGTTSASFDNVTIRNCDMISNYDYGIFSNNATRVNISDVTLNDSNTGGVWFLHTDNSQVVDSNISGGGENIYLEYSDYNLLSRNDLSNCWTHCISVEGYSAHNTISSNRAHDFIFFGYNTRYASDVTFFNNTAYAGADACFWIESCTDCFLVNNTAQDCDDGFRLPDSSFTSQYAFTNNTAFNNTRGFYFGATAPGTIIYANLAYNNSDAGFTVFFGYGYTLEANTAYNNGGSIGGFRTSNSANVTLRDNVAYKNSANGFYDSGSTALPFLNVSFVNNIAYLNGQDGFRLYGNNRTFVNNTAYSNSRAGIYAQNLDNVTFNRTHLYNNTYAFLVNMTDATSRTMNGSYMIFDRGQGDFQDFTNISFSDKYAAVRAYSFNWSSAPATLPMARISFRNKWINISKITADLRNNFTWHWSDSEAAGYEEAEFEIWRYNSTDGWVMMNDTPDTSANELSLVQPPRDNVYGILQSPVNCPVISVPGTFYQPMDYTGAPNAVPEISFPISWACVKIATSDVIFDCNGFNISNTGVGNSVGILVNGSTSKWITNVTIRNCGNISTYLEGVLLYNVSYAKLHNVSVYSSSDNGIWFVSTRNSTIENCTAIDNNDDGFSLAGASYNNNLTNNYAANNTAHGFDIWDGSHNIIAKDNVAETSWSYNYYFTYVVNITAFNNSANYGDDTGFTMWGCTGCRIYNNTAYRNYFDGFDIDGVFNDSFPFINNTAYGNWRGFIIDMENSTFGYNLAEGNEFGFRFSGSDNVTARDLVSYNNLYDGFNIYNSNYVTLLNSSTWNNSRDGMLLRQSDFNNITNVSIVNSTYVAINLSDSQNNNFTNNTVMNSTWGVYIDSSSAGNLFYFNNFLNSTRAHAYAAALGNFFNTTNTSSCPVAWKYCARGNYWDDISTLQIYDQNNDGFGDFGAEYPYSRANNANVSTNVVDEGPIIEGIVDFIPPNGTITIYGPNGTEITGTRSVFLNLSYSDDVCIRGCRWANDNPANLANYPWENCTTVKPWLLSEAEGNKTVYFEVRDCGNNVNISNDSIIYRFMQDYTAPTAPVVFDGDSGIDIDWSNDNTSLSAYWWNATDDISAIYYRYRILNDSVCMFNDCSWTDAGAEDSVSVSGFSLEECSNYSFQVMSYISSGFNSSIATSNGTIIDLTPPPQPGINSSTHPDYSVVYGTNTVRLNFTSSDSGACPSGTEGYSYVLDNYPGTAPDNNLESRFMLPLSSMHNDGSAQLLRASSGIGSPNTYAVFSQIDSNLSAGDVIKVRVALAEIGNDTTDLMGLSVYLISDNKGFSVTSFNNYNRAIADVVNVTRDIRYAESMGSAAVYSFDLVVNSTVDRNLDDAYVVIAGMPGDNDNRNNLSIAAATANIDSTKQTWVCNDSNSCTNTTSWLDLAIEAKLQDSGSSWDVQYDNLPDGIYYFHVKAKDIAGNWGDTAHFNFTVSTGGLAVDILSPFTGQVFTEENITVTVRVSGLANVTVIALHPDGSNDTSDWKVFAGTDTLNVSLENGTNTLYARAVNPDNGVVTYSQQVFVRLGIGVFEANRTLRVLYPCTAQDGHLYYHNEGSMRVGFATENDAAVWGSCSFVSDTSDYSIKIFATTSQMDTGKIDDELDDDDFLDRVNPMFGYERGVSYYIIRTEVRPLSSYLSGDVRVTSGTRTLILKNVGYTPDGKANITVRII